VSEVSASLAKPIADAMKVPVNNVVVKLSPGSVKVDATVQVPSNQTADALVNTLKDTTALDSLATQVTTTLSAMPNLKAATTGTLQAEKASVAKVGGDTTAAATTTAAAATKTEASKGNPAILAQGIQVLTAVALACQRLA